MHTILMHATPIDLHSIVIALSFITMVVTPCVIARISGNATEETETE